MTCDVCLIVRTLVIRWADSYNTISSSKTTEIYRKVIYGDVEYHDSTHLESLMLPMLCIPVVVCSNTSSNLLHNGNNS